MKYIIYQPKEVSFRVDSDKVDYNKADYNKVYEGEINEIATNSELLEKIFEKYNGKIIANFKNKEVLVK